MTRDVTRRDFLGAASLAALALGLPARRGLAAEHELMLFRGLAPRVRARPFDLHDVRLRPGTQLAGLEVNRKYMMGLDPDRLLFDERYVVFWNVTSSGIGNGE